MTVVEGDLKIPFSLGEEEVTTTLHFNLDPYLIILCVEQGGHQVAFFEFLVWLNLGLNTGLTGHLRTLCPREEIYIHSILFLYLFHDFDVVKKKTSMI